MSIPPTCCDSYAATTRFALTTLSSWFARIAPDPTDHGASILSLIIVEGSSCSGKTTLAGKIVDRLRRADPDSHVTYLHCGPPVDHPLDEYVEPLLDYRPGTGRHVVCDRWSIGESVYPVLLDRPTQLTSAVRTYVELFLRSRGAVLVYCAQSYDHARDCALTRGDDRAEVARIHDALELFYGAVTSSLLPFTVEDVTGEHETDAEHAVAVERTIDRVIDVADRFDRSARSLVPYVTYVGPSRPSLMLVGDRRGVDGDPADWGLWPAFAPRPATSGDYLLTTLTSVGLRVPEHGVQLGDVGLVNANDVDDVRSCWEALDRPAVVALGRNAERTLHAIDVPHGSVPHPQFFRRFFNSHKSEYARIIINAGQTQRDLGGWRPTNSWYDRTRSTA